MSISMAIIMLLAPTVAVVVSIALVGFAAGNDTPRRFTTWCNGIASRVNIHAFVIGALAVDVLGLLAIAFLQRVELNDAREDIEHLQRAVIWQQSVIVGDMSREEEPCENASCEK